MSDQAWQSEENHDQSIRNMTKGVVMENLPISFLERLQPLSEARYPALI